MKTNFFIETYNHEDYLYFNLLLSTTLTPLYLRNKEFYNYNSKGGCFFDVDFMIDHLTPSVSLYVV